MGSQQLLLIALGIIVVGVAIVAGVGIFDSGQKQADIDGMATEIQLLGQDAIKYYHTPASLLGGGRNFQNWVIPEPRDSTVYGSYVITGTPDALSATIVGTLNSGGTITATVQPNLVKTVYLAP